MSNIIKKTVWFWGHLSTPSIYWTLRVMNVLRPHQTVPAKRVNLCTLCKVYAVRADGTYGQRSNLFSSLSFLSTLSLPASRCKTAACWHYCTQTDPLFNLVTQTQHIHSYLLQQKADLSSFFFFYQNPHLYILGWFQPDILINLIKFYGI